MAVKIEKETIIGDILDVAPQDVRGVDLAGQPGLQQMNGKIPVVTTHVRHHSPRGNVVTAGQKPLRNWQFHIVLLKNGSQTGSRSFLQFP